MLLRQARVMVAHLDDMMPVTTTSHAAQESIWQRVEHTSSLPNISHTLHGLTFAGCSQPLSLRVPTNDR